MSGALSLVGWWFLPGLVASWTQSIWYSLTIRAGDPKPAPGSPTHATHRRRIQILVTSLYLLYTLYEADHDLRAAGNYYTDLSVPLSASEREIRSRFRRLAAIYHPDKAAPGGHPDDGGSEFMRLKIAADTLASDASRFAYERFGPSISAWRDCANRYEYVARAASHGILPHYLSYAGVLYLMGALGYLDFARYWRWYFLAAMALLEAHLATRPSSRTLDALNALLALPPLSRPPLLQFQAVTLARRCCVTMYLALSQIGPLLYPPARPGGDADAKALNAQLDRVAAAAMDADGSATRLLDVGLAPYRGDEAVTALVKRRIAEWLVQNTIKADPMVKDALGRTLAKRRADVPVGAKGNR